MATTGLFAGRGIAGAATAGAAPRSGGPGSELSTRGGTPGSFLTAPPGTVLFGILSHFDRDEVYVPADHPHARDALGSGLARRVAPGPDRVLYRHQDSGPMLQQGADTRSHIVPTRPASSRRAGTSGLAQRTRTAVLTIAR
jgi:hypothetical protein